MNHARKRFLIHYFCCLFTQTILCNTQNINRNSEEFLSKLRSNIKMFKRYVEGKKPVEFTSLRVAGDNINMTEFCKLNQRLCGRDEPEKQICIITVRNTSKSDTCDADNLIGKLIRGLQIHLNQNGNTVLLSELGVSIDHIKKAYIADYDKITKTTDDFFGKHEKLEEMIIDNIYWISCDAIVVILHDIIFSFLYRIENLDDIYKRLRNGSFKVISQEMLYKMIKTFADIVQKGNIIEKLDTRFWSKCSTFDILYRVICTYEKTNRIDTFSNRSSKFQNVYFYLLKIKYAKLIEKSIRHLLMSICKIFENNDNVKRFEEYFAPLCYEYIRKQNGTSYSAPWTTKYEDKRSLFHSNKLFLDKTENFLKALLTDDMMRIHGKTMQPMIKRLRQKQSEENITRIFYDIKLTKRTVYQLCSILQNSNGHSDFYKHQFIYVNSGKGILKGEEHILTDQCEAILSNCNPFDSVIEIKSTVQALNESTKPMTCQMFTCTRRNVAGKFETSANHSDLTKSSNTNIITIDKYTEPMGDTARKEYIEKCIKSCIDDAKSIIFDSWVITVTSEHNQSLIYMITYGKNDVSEERVLLIFDVPSANRPANCLDSRHSDRYIRCIEDAQEPVLHKLIDNLQALQLAACTKLHIPNVCYALDYDYTYTEKIFTETGFDSPKKIVYDYIRSTQMTHDIYMLCDNTPIESVLNYEEKRFGYTLQLFNFFNKLGIDLYCFESYLFELISNRAYSGCADKESTTNDEYNRNCKISICYTLQADNSATLHIIKKTKMSFKDSAITNSAKLLCKMLEYQEFSCLLKALDLTQSYNCKTTFLTSLIDAVCKSIFDNNLIGSGKFYIEDDACEKIISECTENHRKGILNSSITSNGKYTEPSRLYQQAFDKSLDQDGIRDLAKTIVRELKTLSNTRLVTITSITFDTGSLRSQKLDVLFNLRKK